MAGKQTARRRPNPRRRRAMMRTLVVSLLGLVLVMVALPTVVVLVVGLLPALTWYIVDLTPGRLAFRCIARFNAAGLAPALHRLWWGANDMDAAIDIVTDPFAWMGFLGAAAVGWLAYNAVPAVVMVANEIYAKNRIGALREVQHALEREWGPAVAGEAARPGAPGDGDGEAADEPVDADRVPA